VAAPASGRVTGSILVAAAVVAGTAAAHAQALYQGQFFSPTPVYRPTQPPYRAQPSFPPPLYRQVPAAPPSWNYDPYTDGTVPTPHGGSG